LVAQDRHVTSRRGSHPIADGFALDEIPFPLRNRKHDIEIVGHLGKALLHIGDIDATGNRLLRSNHAGQCHLLFRFRIRPNLGANQPGGDNQFRLADLATLKPHKFRRDDDFSFPVVEPAAHQRLHVRDLDAFDPHVGVKPTHPLQLAFHLASRRAVNG